jgi:6-phosphogluconolactonase (cycloisomerase 2 family)
MNFLPRAFAGGMAESAHMQTSLKHALQVCVAVGVATVPMIAAALMQSGGGAARVAVYASVGEELLTFNADIASASLTRTSSIMLPGFVQEAWVSPSGPFLYVAWSNGGASYNGSGVDPVGDKHGITAFRVDSTGALHAHGAPAVIRSRPIYITGDRSARHLLVAYNDPSGISVHAINADGTVGAEMPQSGSLDVGIYAHNVRVLPSNDAVVLVTRGNEPTKTTKEDPGALKVFRFDNGALTNTASIAPSNGIGFRSRHIDFHPTRPWAFLTVEAQNRLEVFGITKSTLTSQPLFNKATLADGTGVKSGQTTSTLHVHPNGQYVYVANRGAAEGGTNNIAVFRINQDTGEPSLIQNIDTHGLTPRTFSVDPSGRMLVVGNQTTQSVAGHTVPANLAVFRIRADGMLDFAQRYDLAVGRKPLWWTGLVPLR